MDANLAHELVSIAGEELAAQFSKVHLDEPAVAALRRLVAVVKAHTSQLDVEEAEAERQATEYAEQAERLHEQLQLVGITPDRLSLSARSSLQSLAAAGSELGLANASDVTLAAAWTALCLEDMRVQRMADKLNRQVSALSRALERVKAEQPAMEQALREASAQLDSFDAQIKHMLQPHLVDLQAKIRTYKAKAHKATQRLKDVNGWSMEISHNALVELSANNDQLHSRLQEARAALAAYQGLPPSQMGAELRLRQLREHLAGLQAQLQRGMANLD